MALQGIIVSVIPFLLEKPEDTMLVNVGVLLVIVIVKGLVIPGMLLFAIPQGPDPQGSGADHQL